MAFIVYLLASGRNGTLYVGRTDDLARRMFEHREGAVPSFTAKHGVTGLVWLESHDTREAALLREKRIKEWKRVWKLRLIEGENPEWHDLYDDLNNLLTF